MVGRAGRRYIARPGESAIVVHAPAGSTGPNDVLFEGLAGPAFIGGPFFCSPAARSRAPHVAAGWRH
ncbi:hypothetical protein RGE_01140 [Rubrivivax gelatinosus IL144]|uniref:Uncharacterized protein n=1 Tax=Rubrivivax gelatinosus (strain NBRC 100245 / IL144) TaxID=983917 RepID=I0HKC2_RUBGI|nr:hypothetical protein RGE_01140 [Rubrivivax gelatinosus IL144]